jgi:Ca-activated chloride channel family protein
MKGEKVEQVKKALKFCLEKLDRKDRFAIIQFSTAAQGFADKWSDATAENLEKACQWAEAFEAAGGTNIAEALQKTFALPYEESRPATVLFLTDGRPTVDTTDTEALMKLVKDNNRRNLRIFTFGVGDDVNTHLVDRIAGETGGLPEYVRQGEAIDGKVTRLFSKMSHPVLTDLAIEVPGVRVTEMYPKQLPDLFRGGQVVILGAYEGDGDSAIRLKGRAGKKREELVYEGTFPKKAADRNFIGPLYANRKIGYLLDQVRLHGENKELKDEVVRLSLAYGIETPYTSYLVLENREQYKQYNISIRGAQPAPKEGVAAWSAGGGGGGPAGATPGAPSAAGTGDKAGSDGGFKRAAERVDNLFGALPAMAPPAGTALPPAAPAEEPNAQAAPDDRTHGYVTAGVRAEAEDLRKADTGKTAVDIAQQIQGLRQSEQVGRRLQKVQQRGSRQFADYRGVWVDQGFQGAERLVKIKWGSEAFFRLAREKADVRDALSQGQRVIVVTARGQAIAIDPDDGAEKLSDEEFKAIFTDAPAK